MPQNYFIASNRISNFALLLSDSTTAPATKRKQKHKMVPRRFSSSTSSSRINIFQFPKQDDKLLFPTNFHTFPYIPGMCSQVRHKRRNFSLGCAVAQESSPQKQNRTARKPAIKIQSSDDGLSLSITLQPQSSSILRSISWRMESIILLCQIKKKKYSNKKPLLSAFFNKKIERPESTKKQLTRQKHSYRHQRRRVKTNSYGLSAADLSKHGTHGHCQKEREKTKLNN